MKGGKASETSFQIGVTTRLCIHVQKRNQNTQQVRDTRQGFDGIETTADTVTLYAPAAALPRRSHPYPGAGLRVLWHACLHPDSARPGARATFVRLLTERGPARWDVIDGA